VGVKRIVDALLSGALLVALSPLLLAIATAIQISMGNPVFFKQSRPGLGGKPFTLVKFRTMRDAYDASGQPLPDDSRLTRSGAVLRRLSVDELPELWNVLKGDMSLVGPRPLLMQYLDRYTPQQARRHEVKPGITGLAQVSGRNALSWEDRLALDVWYVNHWSLWLDVKILARTVWQVFARRGVSAPGHATMPEFRGDDRG
jgi:lipopolysaccharide/colanic/teichoic acid biosynthesis glycosyltransferase